MNSQVLRIVSLVDPKFPERKSYEGAHSMPKAPQISSARRPNFSMVQKDKGVEPTLTTVVIMLITNGVCGTPACWKKVVPVAIS